MTWWKTKFACGCNFTSFWINSANPAIYHMYYWMYFFSNHFFLFSDILILERLLKIFCHGIKLQHYYLYSNYFCGAAENVKLWVIYSHHEQQDRFISDYLWLQPSGLMKEAATFCVYQVLIAKSENTFLYLIWADNIVWLHLYSQRLTLLFSLIFL